MVLSSCCSSIARVHPGSRGERSTAPMRLGELFPGEFFP